VCAADGLDRWLVLDVLASLVDKSLVAADGTDRLTRYRMLETVREYARQLLEGTGELRRVRDRHLEFFAELANRGAVELDFPRNATWLDVLEADAANFESAIEHALEVDPERALAVSVALAEWWEVTGRFATAESVLDRGLRATDPSPSVIRARALWRCGQFARYRRDPMAGELFEQAQELAEAIGDKLTLARALRTSGVLRSLRDPASGRPDLERAFDLAESAGDAWTLIWSTTSLAISYVMTDDYADAERVLATAQPVIERAGVEGIAWAVFPLAWCAMVRGDHDRCFELAEVQLSSARELGDPLYEAFVQVVMARVETMRGHADAALARQLASERRVIADGAAMALPLTRLEQGLAYAALGRLDEARLRLELVIAEGSAERWTDCYALLALGNVLRALRDSDGALARARQALDLSEQIGLRSLSAAGHELLARLAIARGEWSEADALGHRALAQRVEIGAPIWLPQSLDTLALVAAGLESSTEAARLLGAAQRARSDLGLVRWEPDALEFQELERALDRQLGTDAYTAARAEGAAIPLDDAIGWARRARGKRKRPSSGWAALTPTELQVIELIAEGLTNPRIAERMFVTRATVKSHLIHIFQKLDVGSRAELAAIAAQRAG
jgi:DNA-binding CsgD family transcriptional regulator